MLSTAQRPLDSKHLKREEELMDEWGVPKVRKPPMTIDVATVVGITVGAFLFILIGTGEARKQSRDRCYDFYNIFAQKISDKMAYFTLNKAKLCKNLIKTLVFKENTNLFA
jgi:hypothetical protein